MAAAVIGLASAGAKIFGGIMGARNAEKQAKQAREVTEANYFRILNEQTDLVENSLYESERHAWEAQIFRGETFAQIAATALDPNAGSAARVQAQNAALIVRDAGAIRSNLNNNLRRLSDQANIILKGGEAQAGNILALGRATSLQSFTQAGADVVQGLSDLYDTSV